MDRSRNDSPLGLILYSTVNQLDLDGHPTSINSMMGMVWLLLMGRSMLREAGNKEKRSRLYITFYVFYYDAKLDTVQCRVATSTHPQLGQLGRGLDSLRTDSGSPLHMTTLSSTFVTGAGTLRRCGCMKPIKCPVHNSPVDGRLFTGGFWPSPPISAMYHQRSVTSERSEL